MQLYPFNSRVGIITFTWNFHKLESRAHSLGCIIQVFLENRLSYFIHCPLSSYTWYSEDLVLHCMHTLRKEPEEVLFHCVVGSKWHTAQQQPSKEANLPQNHETAPSVILGVAVVTRQAFALEELNRTPSQNFWEQPYQGSTCPSWCQVFDDQWLRDSERSLLPSNCLSGPNSLINGHAALWQRNVFMWRTRTCFNNPEKSEELNYILFSLLVESWKLITCTLERFPLKEC